MMVGRSCASIKPYLGINVCNVTNFGHFQAINSERCDFAPFYDFISLYYTDMTDNILYYFTSYSLFFLSFNNAIICLVIQ